MNIEAVIINYLKTALETDHVYAEVPVPAPAEFFVIDKTGSSTTNRICTSTVAIQSYGPSKFRASELNEAIKQAMDGIVTLDSIGACHIVSDYNFSNIAKKQHRYQAVFDITHY